MKVTVRETEAGLVFRKGKLTRVLDAGSHLVLNAKIFIIDRKRSLEEHNFNALDLITNTWFRDLVTGHKIRDGQIGLHYVDGIFSDTLLPGTHTYFNAPFQHEVTLLSGEDIFLPDHIAASVKETICRSHPKLFVQELIAQGQIGALYVDGKFHSILPSGSYCFSMISHKILVKRVNMLPSILTITGQEMLSKDKITLRFNLFLSYRIRDPEKLLNASDNYDEMMRLMMQMTYREYIASRTLEEILSERESISGSVLAEIKEKGDACGIEFTSCGIKDIILPGDVRDILNTVLIAEKKAMANVITRREETASTRSLLNTAKLMEENKTLYRLKELEYLERIFDKVQSISLNSSSSAVEQLTSLISGKEEK